MLISDADRALRVEILSPISRLQRTTQRAAADLAAFASGLQQGRFLSPQQLETAWTPGTLADGSTARVRFNSDSDGYGFGWFITSFAGKRLLSHGGGITGFSANLYHFPDQELTIAILANAKGRDDGVAPVDPLARRIAEHFVATMARRPITVMRTHKGIIVKRA